MLLCVFAVALFATACGGSSGDDGSDSDEPHFDLGGDQQATYNGALVTPALPKPDIVLTDTSGQPFDLRKETEGYLTLFYIGYTHCPDVCPLHMSDIAATLKKMSPDAVSKIKVVFVTSDPARDTPDVLRTWLDTFNPSYIGLVPTPDQLNELTDAVGMPRITREDGPDGTYGVTHAAYVTAYTTDDIAHIVYPLGVSRDDWAHDLPLLAVDGWQGS
jgi:protein SCO1/2